MGFSVSVSSTISHVSILIEDTAADSQFNIADMGFGYSQILPLLTAMWAAQRKNTEGKTPMSDHFASEHFFSNQIILAIEQPELHLHPRMQARLSDLYCNIVAQSASGGSDISFVIETHSETIINRIGRLVHEKRISASDVAVLIVEKEAGFSTVATASFDDDGFLVNWPYGFFLP
jgi:predicted ATPase